MEIVKEENTSKGRMVAKDGDKEMGEMTFSVTNDFIIVDHTEVADEYKGQGVGVKLFWAQRCSARKIGKSCRYVLFPDQCLKKIRILLMYFGMARYKNKCGFVISGPNMLNNI